MMRAARHIPAFCFLLLLGACSPGDETPLPGGQDPKEQQPARESEPTSATNGTESASETVSEGTESEAKFEQFADRLAQMKAADRRPGQTMLTGKTLVFNYDERSVRMSEDVVMLDDDGELKAESLIGRFSISNEVEFIEATGGVSLISEDRQAEAEHAVYNHASGLVQMEGHAWIAEGGNRLSGERIRFWIRDHRKMVCEPNALLVVRRSADTEIEGLAGQEVDTEIRANRVVYDESSHRAELLGNVRLRDARVAMNCEEVRIYLKESNKLDWIEAAAEVIIQTDDRKALADRATYDADEGKFTLEGNPKVMQGRNVMTGDRIIFWHETRHMVCEPNGRVLLYLDEETKAKFLKDLND